MALLTWSPRKVLIASPDFVRLVNTCAAVRDQDYRALGSVECRFLAGLNLPWNCPAEQDVAIICASGGTGGTEVTESIKSSGLRF